MDEWECTRNSFLISLLMNDFKSFEEGRGKYV